MSNLVERLEGVRQTGSSRWIARCPAHDDRSPSLAVSEVDDGRTLVHCFGGCDALSVVHAVGLEMSDLFPEQLSHHVPPTRSRIPASDRLRIIADEALAVGVIAGRFLDKKRIEEDEWDRLAVAIRKIEGACHASN